VVTEETKGGGTAVVGTAVVSVVVVEGISEVVGSDDVVVISTSSGRVVSVTEVVEFSVVTVG
jgi:hypothetical protein